MRHVVDLHCSPLIAGETIATTIVHIPPFDCEFEFPPMTTWAEVDLTAIKSNAQAIQEFIRHSGAASSDVHLIAVIKADAYGHGAIPVAQALRDKTAMFAVATVQEAIELRDAGIEKPILILFNAVTDEAEPIVRYQLTPSVCESTLCKKLSYFARTLNKCVRVHVDVDTGMNRGGIRYTEAARFVQWLTSLYGIAVQGIFTHFATADETDKSYAHLQLDRFKSVISELSHLNLRPPMVHAANSAATLMIPDSHFDAVRVGLSLYGIHPLPNHNVSGASHAIRLKPSLSWKSRVIYVHEAGAGESVGYGRTFKTNRSMRLATIRVGYADGYTRSLSNLGEALIGGIRRRSAGGICMDETVFEIDPPGDVAIGDEAVLIGMQGAEEITADQVAARAGTISYEILTGISRRVRRVHVEAPNKTIA